MSFVVDASAVVALLRGAAPGAQVACRLADQRAAAPAHLDVEVLSALGRLTRANDLDETLVEPMLARLRSTPIRRYPLAPLLPEAWWLRHNVALRDAPYVALARRLGWPLLTLDSRLSRAPALGIAVDVVPS